MPCCIAKNANTSPVVLPGLIKDLINGPKPAELPPVFNLNILSPLLYDLSSPPNRGSTYLRCCVLLI
jgi:hypothetical protein